MKKVIHLSDIHYRSNWQENQGVVLDGLFVDLKKQLIDQDVKDIYVVFSGDIVLAGENSNLYEEFIDVFDKALNDIGVGIDNRICVPGNHDVSRKDVIENNVEHNGVISQLTTEKEFNDYTAKSKNVFQKKFTNYGVFEKKFSKMGVVNDLYCGTGHALNESIGVYCLNTAISSCAESGDDKDVLMINTRKLVEWSRQNNLPCKILIMHHPIEWLEDWSKKELRTILESDFSLCLSGHTHDQTIYHSSDNGSLMTCCAPALFTNKNDDLGYSIIDINDNGKIENVTYRQWTKRRNFTKGVNFTDGEDGVVHIKKSADTAPKDAVENSENKSVINRIFSQRLDEALKSFSSQPRVWVEPTLMSCAEDVKCDEDIEPEDLTELTLNPRSIIIQAPPQFGQTCLAYYLVKKAWMKNRLWMYLNAKKLKNHTIDKAIKSELELLDLNISDIQCIVLDSWVAQDSSAIKILKKIVEKYTDIPVVIMQSIDDIQVMNEVISLDFDRKLDTLYIWSLSRDKIRTLVTGYNDERHIGEDESVICKVISDTQALNMHRTPLNCLTLLKVSEIGFDDSPVNRTEVIKRVLFLLFSMHKVKTFAFQANRFIPNVIIARWIIVMAAIQFTTSNIILFG
ncbi:MAG: metallophosphoesterase [Methylococcales bacterium]